MCYLFSCHLEWCQIIKRKHSPQEINTPFSLFFTNLAFPSFLLQTKHYSYFWVASKGKQKCHFSLFSVNSLGLRPFKISQRLGGISKASSRRGFLCCEGQAPKVSNHKSVDINGDRRGQRGGSSFKRKSWKKTEPFIKPSHLNDYKGNVKTVDEIYCFPEGFFLPIINKYICKYNFLWFWLASIDYFWNFANEHFL